MTGPAPDLPVEVAGLAPFVAAGLFGPAEVQVAATVARLAPGTHPHVLLAVAVATRAPRLGHVGIELDAVAERMLDRHQEHLRSLPWPEAAGWAELLARSPVVAVGDLDHPGPVRPLRWDGSRIYLQRYWDHEVAVAGQLTRRAAPLAGDPDPEVPGSPLRLALDALFPPVEHDEIDLQRRAAAVALAGRLAVVAGGPGTGKTRTIARLLAAAHREADAGGRRLEVALAAPTGKAAARMTEAVALAVDQTEADGTIDADLAARLRATEATTIHRLLGPLPGAGFHHDEATPLPHDLVVVDEASMVSLPLMARLLAAVRPQARLVLVGDPHQLASVDAGTVLSDVVGPFGTGPGPAVGPLAARTTVLRRVHRFDDRSGIAALADAVRDGRGDDVVELLRRATDDVRWVHPEDATALGSLDEEVAASARRVVAAALEGDAAAGLEAATAVKVLAGTRQGPNGLRWWSTRIEDAVAATVPGYERHRRWAVGRPVLVTENDPANRVANGDVGLTVASAGGGPAVALLEGTGLRLVAAARLRATEPWWAMTIHKSQGSEFPHVVVALPPDGSPLLTRELLYTAVTRARRQVTVVADEAALRTAVGRPVARASGLRDRLWPG